MSSSLLSPESDGPGESEARGDGLPSDEKEEEDDDEEEEDDDDDDDDEEDDVDGGGRLVSSDVLNDDADPAPAGFFFVFPSFSGLPGSRV